MSPALRGIFLTSKEPELPAKFYRDVAGLELEQIGDSEEYVYWKVDKAGAAGAPHHSICNRRRRRHGCRSRWAKGDVRHGSG